MHTGGKDIEVRSKRRMTDIYKIIDFLDIIHRPVFYLVRQDSAVGIATGYGLDGREFESR
jgi:hypothetical protein